MATVVQCHPTTQPTGTESGSRPSVYTAKWAVELDDQIDMKEMLRLARAVTPSATVTPLPEKGSFFRWVSPGGNRSVDDSVYALDFESSSALDNGKLWTVNVRWRTPNPGADEEPDRVNVAPLRRRPYYWIEYYTETEEIFDARPRISIGQGNALRPAGRAGAGPITTSAGEEIDLATDERLHTVLVCERYASSQRTALIINSLYFGMINNNRWRIPPEFTNVFDPADPAGRVFKYHARFLRAETSQYGEWRNGTQYFKMQIRVRLASKPFFRQVPNRGTWFYNEAESSVELFRDSDGVLGKTNLKRDGTVDTANKPFLVPYQIAGDRTFNNTLRFT